MEHKKCFKTLIALAITLAMMLTFIPFIPTALADGTAVNRATNQNLYDALKAAHSELDGDANGIILQSELEALTGVLNLNNGHNITNISGLEWCSGISDLYLDNNSGITNIDALGGNTMNMSNLSLAATGVTSVPGSLDMPYLSTLVLSGTHITDAGLQGISASNFGSDNTPSGLQNLYLENCQNLYTINGISDETYNVPSLSSLYLTSTNLTSFPSSLGRLVNLESLGLDNIEHLSTIPNFHSAVTSLPMLYELYISGTDVKDVSFLSPTAAPNLRCLYWGYAPTALTPAEVGTAAGLTQIIVLDLYNDNIGDAGLAAIGGMTNLKSLIVDWNNISSLTAIGGLDLTTLICNSNRITSLEPIRNMTGMRNLQFSGNEVTDMGPLSGITILQTCYCSYNYISDLGPIAGKPIGWLRCDHNYLDPSVGSADMDIINAFTLSVDEHGNQKQIDITYSYDAAKGSTPSKTTDLVYYGQSFTPPAITAGADYVFLGWDNDASDGTTQLDVASGASTSVALPRPVAGGADAVTYTAVYADKHCTIHFDTQGYGSVADQYADYGTTISAPAVMLRTGYVFAGWYSTPACNTAHISFPYTVTGSITLYAKWILNTYTVTFDPRNGAPVTSVIAGYNTTISAPAVSKTGYSINGWYKETACTTPWNFASDKVTGNITLYAGWTPNNYTVSFDAQGGTVSPGNKAVTYNAAYGPLPAPTRAGYSFAGWRLSGGTPVANASIVTTAADHTLYAAWQFIGAYLTGIQNTCGTWNKAFVKTTYSYKITLGENDPALTLTPIKEYDGATLTANKALSGISPANGKSIKVKITVKCGTQKKAYTITVTRAKSTNNNLSSLTAVGGTFVQPFDPAVTNYTLNVDQNTKSVTIKGTAAAGKLASVSPASKKITLNNGDAKIFKITVKAQSGAKKVYTITVVRAPSADASLKLLKASGAALMPAFSAGNKNYSITLPANKGSVTLTAKSNGYKAAVYINDVKRSSFNVALASATSQTVHIRVVAQSGEIKDYYININRL